MRNYHTSKAIKRIGRVVMVFVMVAAMLTCAVPVHADAKAKTVTSARKYKLWTAPTSKKGLSEYKALPTVKVGKTTVKVSGITKRTKKTDGDGVLNGIIGNAEYDYYTFVKFKVPSTGYYYITFDNLKVKGKKDTVYNIHPTFYRAEIHNKNALWYGEYEVCGKRWDYTEDYTFKDGYEMLSSAGTTAKEITTSNYTSVMNHYLDTQWEAYYRANYPDAEEEDVAEAKRRHLYMLDRAVNDFYEKHLPDENGAFGSVENFAYDPDKMTYRTYGKLDKGEEILFIFTNPVEFKWKPYDGDDLAIGCDARRVVSKASYTIDLTIKKK